jgi:hypothetical protein
LSPANGGGSDLSAPLEESIGVPRIVMHVVSGVNNADMKGRDTRLMQEGRIMARMGELETSGSWLERGRAQGAVTPSTSVESGLAAAALPRDSIEGWDPYEVWLRRVHQPRSRVRLSQSLPENT